ncbi:MAG: ABC transporter transmembrane domain-containing protein, partial [Rhodanobacteraceae bacterium]
MPSPDDVATRKRKLSAYARILPYFRRFRGLLAGWLIFLALSSAATLVLPLAVRYMIDRGFAHADPATINASFLALFGVACVMAIASAGRFFFVSLFGERVVADLRRRLYT